jgi:hypothetical protein
MNLNPAAVTYGRRPSAVFPDLDAEFPSHEYVTPTGQKNR